MIRFLHIGDIHFDSTFYSKNGEIRRRLRQGIRDAFKNSVDYCIKNKVDALLIAGDLFDNSDVSFETEKFLNKQFKRLEQCNVDIIYVTGNHDPGNELRFLNEIENTRLVVIADDEPCVIDKVYNGEPCRIVTVGHKERQEDRNLIRKFPKKDADIPYIAVVHTMVGSNYKEDSPHKNYLPTTKQDIKSKEYDYWALGHIHKREYIDEDKTIAYSGNIQGRSFKELGDKGGILVEFNNGLVSTEYIPFSLYQFANLQVDNISSITTYIDLSKYLNLKIREYIKHNNIMPEQVLMRIELVSKTSLYKELMDANNLELLIEDLKEENSLLYLEINTEGLTRYKDIDEDVLGNPYIKYINSMFDNMDLVEELKLIDLDLIGDEMLDTKNKKDFITKVIKESKDEIINMFIGD